MPLTAKKAEPITKRLKLFLYGDPGAGKTTAAIQFPRSYIIDCERGTDHYSRHINASKSVVLQTVDADEVIQEVRSLGTDKHDYRTLIIDPITTMEADLVQKGEKLFGAGDMRIWGLRDRTMRRLMNLIIGLDMNVPTARWITGPT
jgi:DNA polymerase III delta prime subunit